MKDPGRNNDVWKVGENLQHFQICIVSCRFLYKRSFTYTHTNEGTSFFFYFFPKISKIARLVLRHAREIWRYLTHRNSFTYIFLNIDVKWVFVCNNHKPFLRPLNRAFTPYIVHRTICTRVFLIQEFRLIKLTGVLSGFMVIKKVYSTEIQPIAGCCCFCLYTVSCAVNSPQSFIFLFIYEEFGTMFI